MKNVIHLVARANQVIWIIGRFVLLPSLISGRVRRSRPQSLRLGFERLGRNWIKLGQALALRFDLLPADFCRELLAIQNDLKPVAYPIIRQILAEELGRFPEELFLLFEPEPFAITSVGQLHRAIAPDNQRLVVKVQEISIQKDFAIDVRLMRLIAGALDWFEVFEANSARGFVNDFARSAMAEMNFQTAMLSAQRMSALAIDDVREVNAEICPGYTTRRVLTWEYIEGIPVAEIIDAIRLSNTDYLSDLADRGYDLSRIARNIYRNALNQIFRDGIFHADLSPAGLLVLPDSAIAYVDFAVIVRISEERQDSLRYYCRCILDDKLEHAVDELLYCISPSPSVDLVEFRRDLTRVLEDYLDGFRSRACSAPRQAAHHSILDIMSVIRKHRLVVPRDLTVYFTTMLTLESVVFDLSPSFDAVAEQSIFFSRAASLDIADALKPAQAYDSIVSYYQDAKQLIANLRKIQNSGRMIEISLRTLRIRLLQYGFSAILFTVAAYLSFHDQAFHRLQISLGLEPHWVPGAFLVLALFLVARMWRQGRRLAAMDRSIVTTREISGRSFGRVR